MPPSDTDSLPAPAFDYFCRTRVIFGVGTTSQVGSLARELGGTKVLLVTDRGLIAAGHAGRVQNLLEAAGLKVTLFQDAEQNPTTRCVRKCVARAREAGIDLLVGLGGGSSMDTAKGCNFILTNGGEMKDYWGIGKATKPMLPLIAIPTTGGTGSECQSFALIADEHTHQKMACGDPKASARIAILDPALTVTQPPRVTACTGIDAIAHAVESAVTKRRTPVSALFSRESFRLTARGFPEVLASPDNLEARGQMLLGAAWAGVAIENSMLGAAHAAANPLTAHYDVVHGLAVGHMLPHVVRFNAAEPEAASIYADLVSAAGWGNGHSNVGEVLSDTLKKLLTSSGLETSLRDLGLKEKDIPALAKEAAAQWTAQFNPRPISAADFEKIYRTTLLS